MSKPIAYKTGTIQPPNTAKQNNVLVGVGPSNWGAGVANANFYNSLDSSYQYVVIKNSSVPAMWATGDFTTGSLLTTINGLPDRVGQTRFTNANTAISWSLASGEYTILKNELPYGGPITNGLVLDFNPKVNNYFANGDFAYGTTIGWVAYGGSISISDITNDRPYVGSKTTKALINTGGSGFTWGRYTSPIYGPAGLLVVGQRYTFSFWAKVVGGGNYNFGFDNQNGSGDSSNWNSDILSDRLVTSTWKKFSGSFTYSNSKNFLYIYGPNAGGNLMITEFQLEDGNTANTFSSFPVTAAGLTIPNNGLLNSSSFSLTNGPYLVAGNQGIIKFDGVDDYVQFTSDPFITTSLTYAAWVYSDAFNSRNAVFNIRGTLFELNSGGLAYWSDVNGGQGGASYSFTTGSWNFVAVTQNNTSVTYYVNGSQIGTATMSSINMNVGSSNYNFLGTYTGGQRFLNGKIGNAQIYNRALSAAEIENLYEANAFIYFPTSSIVNQGLSVYYDFSNPNSYPGSGTTVYDLSGYGNNGTLTNGPTFSTDSGGALVFDGVDDYVQFTSTYAGTICFWGIADAGATDGLQALVGVTSTGDGALRFLGGTFRGNATGAEAGTADNNDYQFGYVNQFMINGVSSLPKTGQGYYIVPNGRTLTQNFYVGAIGNRNVSTLSHTFLGRVYKGKIFKVMIYNRQLTNAELLQNYNAFKAQYGL
jgi:hypothetical protein